MRRMMAAPSPCGVFRRGDLSLPDGKGSVQPTVAANDPDGSQPAEDGASGLARAGRYDHEPLAEDAGRPNPLPPCRWSDDPARSQHQHQVPGRWRMAAPQAWRSGATPIVGWQGIAKQSLEWVRKLHLAMDSATSDIRAVECAPSSDGDSPVLPESLDQILEGEEIGTVTTDDAHDTRRCHTASAAPMS